MDDHRQHAPPHMYCYAKFGCSTNSTQVGEGELQLLGALRSSPCGMWCSLSLKNMLLPTLPLGQGAA